jgi:hypothetical protein
MHTDALASRYAAAARAAVRKLRKRVGHVITVAASELDNSVDPAYRAAIDAILSRIEEADPLLGEATKALGRNPTDEGRVADFRDSCTTVVTAVRDLRQCMEGPNEEAVEDEIGEEEEALLLQAAAVVDARDAEDDAVFEVATSPPIEPQSPDRKGFTTPDRATMSPATPCTPTSATDDAMAFATLASVPETPGATVVRAAVKLRREANKWSEVSDHLLPRTDTVSLLHISAPLRPGAL